MFRTQYSKGKYHIRPTDYSNLEGCQFHNNLMSHMYRKTNNNAAIEIKHKIFLKLPHNICCHLYLYLFCI